VAQRAIELDPTLAEPHAALAVLKEQADWDWAGAADGLGFRQEQSIDFKSVGGTSSSPDMRAMETPGFESFRRAAARHPFIPGMW